ncbi:carbohydrate binding domain protein [Aspergillus novofumigatus IBT 16806]|uniref:Carbohydrate binding domain protein n=1 Tax=Aspergillus novofumigatus (strain IBT 16806) TaxID=1392255 RepID=A0A2I1BUI9_ASPN1|nr:carbohydrate binding domain protein [Aspergillus novofumigatus IBT 16806]PKX89058.1 carbohydrate binding domain protein [Aspergillus novofumigatus IBT 16806]
MALSTPCNLVANPSFESGNLFPWFPSALNVAKISNATEAYDGDYYLDLQTAIGNRGNTISQPLRNLDPSIDYTFSVQVQAASPAANYCSFYVYMGKNSTTGFVATDILYNSGEWTSITGHYRPRLAQEYLNIVASCTFEGSSYTGRVFIDDVVLAPSNCEDGV